MPFNKHIPETNQQEIEDRLGERPVAQWLSAIPVNIV